MSQHLIFLVEEPSMEAFLETLLPRLFPDTTYATHPFQGKHDLLRKLPDRLRRYKRRLPSSSRIFVLIDKDNSDCFDLKNKLEDIAQKAGLKTPSKSVGLKWQLVNRIVIEELESWYFGDWDAVRKSYNKMPDISGKSKYRTPDKIKDTWETFEKEMQKRGYFKTGLRKIEAARAIAAHIDPKLNRSHSFNKFHESLKEAAV